MYEFATTKLSSKGQIVIPETVRQNLNLEPGTQFIIMARNDTIILKMITRPSEEEFNAMLVKTRKAVKEAGLTKQDLKNAIKEARKKKQ